MRIEEGSVKRARKHWISNSTLHSSNLRSGTGGDRTHISRFKRPVHCLVCHNPVRFQLTSLADSAWWEWNPRPAPYKDAALTTELHAVASRAGGNRTHTERIFNWWQQTVAFGRLGDSDCTMLPFVKSVMLPVTPQPHLLVGRMRFNRDSGGMSPSFS